MNLLEIIEKRRSVRDFDPDKKVGKEDLEKIIYAGEQAPVGKGKYNDIHFTIVQSKSVIDKIVDASKAQNKSYTNNVFYNAPTIIIVSAAKLDEFSELAYQNTGCISQNMLLMATELGIDSLYVFSAIRSIQNNKEILDDLKIPDGFTPTVALVFGYNKNDTRKKFPRKVKNTWLS